MNIEGIRATEISRYELLQLMNSRILEPEMDFGSGPFDVRPVDCLHLLDISKTVVLKVGLDAPANRTLEGRRPRRYPHPE